MYNLVFDGPTVELVEMLLAREQRVSKQQQLIQQWVTHQQTVALLSMTMNIPGPVKNSNVLKQTFENFIQKILHELADTTINHQEFLSLKTGMEAYFVIEIDALTLKKRLIQLEESTSIGRLMDLDVVELLPNQTLQPISRTQLGYAPRTCLICDDIAKNCARSRKHSVEAMQLVIQKIIQAENNSVKN